MASSIHARDGQALPGILVEDVVSHRAGRRVFDGLSVALHEPRIGLIGDNGAGKSSLFRLLCGLDAPERGQVRIGGVDPASRRVAPSSLVALMFQNPEDQLIFPTVAEELAFSLQAQGVARRESRERARRFMAERGLEAWAARTIESLSQGQRQHVCLLALLIASPRVLLLDEPFASLDLPGQARLAADLHCAAQQVLLATHVLSHVRHFERVIWLDAGRVRADGPGRSVCDAYEADVVARTSRGTRDCGAGLARVSA